jgi:hypothetical protein
VRIALTLAVLAVALPTALFIHQRTALVTSLMPCVRPAPGQLGGGPYLCEPGYVWQDGHTFSVSADTTHPKWEDPAAIAIVLGGLAIGAAIIGRRRAVPAAVELEIVHD